MKDLSYGDEDGALTLHAGTGRLWFKKNDIAWAETPVLSNHNNLVSFDDIVLPYSFSADLFDINKAIATERDYIDFITSKRNGSLEEYKWKNKLQPLTNTSIVETFSLECLNATLNVWKLWNDFFCQEQIAAFAAKAHLYNISSDIAWLQLIADNVGVENQSLFCKAMIDHQLVSGRYITAITPVVNICAPQYKDEQAMLQERSQLTKEITQIDHPNSDLYKNIRHNYLKLIERQHDIYTSLDLWAINGKSIWWYLDFAEQLLAREDISEFYTTEINGYQTRYLEPTLESLQDEALDTTTKDNITNLLTDKLWYVEKKIPPQNEAMITDTSKFNVAKIEEKNLSVWLFETWNRFDLYLNSQPEYVYTNNVNDIYLLQFNIDWVNFIARFWTDGSYKLDPVYLVLGPDQLKRLDGASLTLDEVNIEDIEQFRKDIYDLVLKYSDTEE